MERRDYLKLVAAMVLGAVAGVAVGGLLAVLSGLTIVTVFGGIAGSYLGMIYADWHWGPRSRRIRQKRADEERRGAADAARAAEAARAAADRGGRRKPSAAATAGRGGPRRTARRAADRARR